MPLVVACPARCAAPSCMNHGAGGYDAARSRTGSIVLEATIRRRKVRHQGSTLRSVPVMSGPSVVAAYSATGVVRSRLAWIRHSGARRSALTLRCSDCCDSFSHVSTEARLAGRYSRQATGNLSASASVYDITALATSDAMPAGSANITDSAIFFRIRARAISREPRARRD